MKTLRCVLLFCLQSACTIAFSQRDIVKFQHLDIASGLPQSSVRCVLQDTRGFIWLGTSDGLSRYDGYDIKVYKKDSKKTGSISNNNINDIVEDRNGNLWVATAYELNY